MLHLTLPHRTKIILIAALCASCLPARTFALSPEDRDSFSSLVQTKVDSATKLIEDERIEEAARQITTAWDATRTLQSYDSEYRKDIIKYRFQKEILELANTCLTKLGATFANKGVLSKEELQLTKPEDLILAALTAQAEASKAIGTMHVFDAAVSLSRCKELAKMMRATKDPKLEIFLSMFDRSVLQITSQLPTL